MGNLSPEELQEMGYNPNALQGQPAGAADMQHAEAGGMPPAMAGAGTAAPMENQMQNLQPQEGDEVSLNPHDSGLDLENSQLSAQGERLKGQIMKKFDGPLGLHMAERIKEQLLARGDSVASARLSNMLERSKEQMRQALDQSVTALLDESESSKLGRRSVSKLKKESGKMGRIQAALAGVKPTNSSALSSSKPKKSGCKFKLSGVFDSKYS